MSYEHGGDIYTNTGITLDFSVNTNPLGMPDEVKKALTANVGKYSAYPDPQCRELRAAIAKADKVPMESVVCGNGAADLIYRICYALKPQKALICEPTFSEYKNALVQVGCKVDKYMLTADNGFILTADIVGRLMPDTDILFLCNPNNPTGRLIAPDELDSIMHRAAETQTTVVIDECFLDFTNGNSAKRFLHNMPNLIILKAFTKIYTMAGLRLGYLITYDEELVERINKSAQCWSVSVPAQIAGVTALSVYGWEEKTRILIEKERIFLSEELKKHGLTVFSSEANFMLLHCEKELYIPLLKQGILIRSCKNFHGLGARYSRIAIKTRDENIYLIKAIEEVING